MVVANMVSGGLVIFKRKMLGAEMARFCSDLSEVFAKAINER
jgi:hypothetical protein